jgi:hypothetical protein
MKEQMKEKKRKKEIEKEREGRCLKYMKCYNYHGHDFRC